MGLREEPIRAGVRRLRPAREPGGRLDAERGDDEQPRAGMPDRRGGARAGPDALARMSGRAGIPGRAAGRAVMLVATGLLRHRRPRRCVGAGMARLHECPAHPRRRQEQEDRHEP